jgi:protein tyrosine phosphatase (PTP) superfamily phosphohydrolase (DUF442 family)
MALEGKTEEQIKALKDALLAKVKEAGGKSGNVSLIRDLAWEEDDYWSVRDSLVDAGALTLGRGKGGSVRLVEAVQPTAQVLAPAPGPVAAQADITGQAAEAAKEEVLYEPMAKVLREQWTKDSRFQSSKVEITAKQGKRLTGGTWSRPDITVIGYSVFTYLPGRHFEVATFEVKPPTQVTITAVYEALAHRRSATRSFVIFHVPEELLNEQMDAVIEDICAEAKRHGIGIFVATRPEDYETWDERVESVRFEPDPNKLNEFIAVQVSDGAKEEIVKWFK